jgi:addiction module RelE/StbE family toxin
MAYKIIIEQNAQKDIDDAFEYYKSVTEDIKVLIHLLDDIEQAYHALSINPFFQIRSKHYRALPLKKYPYLVFFEILEKEQLVKILALFNTNQDSQKWI